MASSRLARSRDEGAAARSCILLLSGTVFYWAVEDWTLIQSLYFSVVTLTTVGYGDLSPTRDFSRIFTIIYIFIGLGVLVAFLSSLAKHYIRHKVEIADHAREHLSALHTTTSRRMRADRSRARGATASLG